MFYSHEILTSRKYGVATVWLVATLGSKSSLKRINRKQILEVDVSKACQTIVDPVAPMALRLQGNLLYGVSRVYLQQCGYLLSDAQNAQIALRTMLRTVHDAALDTAAGKARPEQLILEDDPSFLPELAPPPPELLAELNSNFNLDILHSGDSQSLTPFGTQQSSSSSNAGNIDGLILPTSSPVAAGEFRLESDHALGSVSRPSGMLAAGDTINIEDPDFMFGDDGEIIQLSPGTTVPKIPAMPIGTTMPSDAVLSARVRKEHKEGQQASIQVPGDETDIGLPSYGDGLPEVGASSESTPSQSNQHSEVVESSDTVTAPMRRRRVPRTIVADTITELRNKDLAGWKTDYLDNMRTAARQKVQNRSITQAKKNAEYYVWGSGLGAVSQRIFSNRGSNPFDMFIGDKLFESITGMSRTVTGVKHDRDSSIDDTTQGESRRVRQKTGDFEIARGTEDEGFFMPGGGDDVAVEMPREAASALDDQQIFSAMPWNMSASIRGSSAVPRSGRMGMISSADQGRHGSRLVSASPLHGRGTAILLEDLRDLTSDAGYADDEFGLPGLSSDLPEPTVPLNTTSRFCEALSAEGENFIKFVNEQISGKHSRIEADPEAVTSTGTITFEELLPPAENTKMVACQGLMIVLALGTKGMLDVQQHEHLGDIHLKPSEKVLQTIEISDGEESEESKDEGTSKEYPAMTLQQTASEFEDPDEEMERSDDLEGGHFQEQFAAGHAAQEEDDGDSLYAD